MLIKITCQPANNSTYRAFSFSINPTKMKQVIALKRKLALKYYSDPALITLIHQGRILQDQDQLNEAGILQDSVFYVSISIEKATQQQDNSQASDYVGGLDLSDIQDLFTAKSGIQVKNRKKVQVEIGKKEEKEQEEKVDEKNPAAIQEKETKRYDTTEGWGEEGQWEEEENQKYLRHQQQKDEILQLEEGDEEWFSKIYSQNSRKWVYQALFLNKLKKLRDMGFMDRAKCRKALQESCWEISTAIVLLQE